jgi:hypothetical protein
MKSFGLSEYFTAKYAQEIDEEAPDSSRDHPVMIPVRIDDSMGKPVSWEHAQKIKDKFIFFLENSMRDSALVGKMWDILSNSARADKTAFNRTLKLLIEELPMKLHSSDVSIKDSIDLAAEFVKGIRKLEHDVSFAGNSNISAQDRTFVVDQLEDICREVHRAMKSTLLDKYSFDYGAVDVKPETADIFGKEDAQGNKVVEKTHGTYGRGKNIEKKKVPTNEFKTINDKMDKSTASELADLVSDIARPYLFIDKDNEAAEQYKKIVNSKKDMQVVSNRMYEVMKARIRKQYSNISKEDLNDRAKKARDAKMLEMKLFLQERALAFRELARNLFKKLSAYNEKHGEEELGEKKTTNELWGEVAANLQMVCWNEQEIIETIAAVKGRV